MEWIKILSETNPKNKKSKHVIRGIARINEQLYMLDYILFSQFKWWTAHTVKDENDLEPQTSNICYNSHNNTFCTMDELPQEIKQNI